MRDFFSARAIELATFALLATMLATMLSSCNTIEVTADNGAVVTIEGEQTRGNNTITPATDVSVVPVA